MKALKTVDANVIQMGTPYALLESAVANNATVETLEKLMALNERHEANQAKKAFYQAMQEFQRIKPDLPRSQQVSFGGGKTAYNFCPLSEIDKRLREPLEQCSLSYRFETLTEGDKYGVRCIVSHVAGHSEGTAMFAPADGSGNKNSIQGIGSTTTYLQRYTLISAFGLTTADEDNDGAANSDLPYARVLQQNELLRDANILRAVLDMKDSLANQDYETVVGYLAAMPEQTKSSLWLAPTKGGIFTTAEIAQMKSNEYAAARTRYYAELQAQAADECKGAA